MNPPTPKPDPRLPRPGATARAKAGQALARIWRGELSLYEAAYALGGVSALFGSIAGDYFLDLPARHEAGAAGWIGFALVALAELAFAVLCVVAVWRARRGWNGPPHGPLAIGLALLFVWSQLIFTAGWIGWSAIAGLGLAPAPMDAIAKHLLAPQWNALRTILAGS